MRKQQANRRARLYLNGFTTVEADALKVVPSSVPFMKDLISDRKRLVNLTFNQGWSKQKFLQAIANIYEARGCKEPHQRIKKDNVFKLLRLYETDWRKTADPNDPYLLQQKRKHHGGNELRNRDKVLEEKRRYRETHAEQIAEYRRTHRAQINESRRKARLFKRGLL